MSARQKKPQQSPLIPFLKIEHLTKSALHNLQCELFISEILYNIISSVTTEARTLRKIDCWTLHLCIAHFTWLEPSVCFYNDAMGHSAVKIPSIHSKDPLADFIASNSMATRIGSWHLCLGMWMQNLFSSITSSAPIMQTSLELIFASITAPGLARFCNRCQYGSQFVLLNNLLSNLPFSAFAIFL